MIEAFQATLKEAADADLLLHVVDGASPELDAQMLEVQRVLAEIGAADVAQILVYNKLDRMEDTERPRSLVDMAELPGGTRVQRVFVSALSGEGLDLLRARIAELAAPDAGLNPPAPAASAADDTAREAASGEGDEAARTGTYHSHA